MNLLSRLFTPFHKFDLLEHLLAMLVGLGCLGYFAVNWAMHFAGLGQLLASFATVSASLVLSALALFRVPLAVGAIFGGGVICATVLMGGYAELLLP